MSPCCTKTINKKPETRPTNLENKRTRFPNNPDTFGKEHYYYG